MKILKKSILKYLDEEINSFRSFLAQKSWENPKLKSGVKIRIIQIHRTHVILPNSYMLGSSTTNKKNMQLDKGGLNRSPLLTLLNQTIMHICMRRCGLKPQRQQVNYEPSFSRYVNVSSTTYAAWWVFLAISLLVFCWISCSWRAQNLELTLY